MITKRQLGLMISGLGLLALLGILAADLVRAGVHDGIGPTQQAALLAAGAFFLLGLTLLPLGDRPA
jgi:lipopolysaccharide export LptBFGC system permease protein LptF